MTIGEQQIHDLLADLATPEWAKQAIHAALEADPVDAANVFEVIAGAFDIRARVLIETVEAELDARGLDAGAS